MSNTITVYLGALGAIGAIELEVPGLNDLFPINANVAPNARGRRVEPGEYILDSIAYTPKTTEIQAAYGEAIIRFIGENRNKMAIFGGELAPDGGLLPTEGASIRVNNDVLGRIVNYYINESGSEIQLIVTDDGPGLINSIRINKWYGHPANTGRIGLIRPKRFKGKPVEQTFYTDSGLDDSDINDRLMWNLLYSMDDETATETDFSQTYDEGWTGFEGGETWEEIPEAGDVAPDGPEQSDEDPYIADPFADIERQNLNFESQSQSPDDDDMDDVVDDAEVEPEDTAGSAGADDAPDNNY